MIFITVVDSLNEDAQVIKKLIRELLEHHASLMAAQRYDWEIDLRGYHYWEKKLSVEGKRLQTNLLDKFKSYCSIVGVLIRPLSGAGRSNFASLKNKVSEVVELRGVFWESDKQTILANTLSAVDQLQQLLEHLYSSEGEHLFVPDTNALLHNVEIEKWHFEDAAKFVLILTRQFCRN